jgi:hypothetical protein
MEGAQYMHTDIPGLKAPQPMILKYSLIGSIDEYRAKVYGAGDPDIVVSPEQFLGEHKCWDIRAMYNRLWMHWEGHIVNFVVTQASIATIVESHDFTFSSIPSTALCRFGNHTESPHKFDYVPVWIDGMWSGPTPAEDPGLWGLTPHVVLCNGLKADPGRTLLTGWYRTSHIYGHNNTEWSSPSLIPEHRQVAENLWRVRKPIGTNCDCWSEVIRVGRYGAWKKGVLSHEAFNVALEVLS